MAIRSIREKGRCTDCAVDSDFMRRLDRDVLEFVNRGLENEDEEGFNRLALRQFELQYHTVGPYREHCERENISPQTITCWEEIPAVPSFALRKLLRTSLPAEEAERTYDESGVVELRRKRRKMYPDRGAAEVTGEANALLAKEFLFPDVERMRMLLMVPPPWMAPGMVMASGLQHLKQRFGTRDSRFLITLRGLNLKSLLGALQKAQETRQPLALLGATSGLDHFFNACRKEGIAFRLPEGSRVCESGGYAGRYARCSGDEFLEKSKEILGIEKDFCVNAFWTCESSTVYFDATLKNTLSGEKNSRRKKIPPWCRVAVVDTRELQGLPRGETGLLRHFDLTNRSMAFAVQTDKVGFELEDGFEVLGKWNRIIGTADIDRSALHPGGRVAARMMEYFMKWRFAGVGRVHSCLR